MSAQVFLQTCLHSEAECIEVDWIQLVYWASLIAQLVKNLPAMQETPVQFLGREDLLEKG